MNKYGYFETILLADTEGDIIASAHPDDIGKVDVSDREYFRTTLREGKVFSEIMESRLTGNPMFTVTTLISGAETREVLIGAIDLTHFSKQYIDPVTIGETGYAYLINQDGSVIAHPNEEMILTTNVVKEYEFGKKFLQGEHGVFDYESEGQDKQIAYQRVPGTGWVLAAGATLDELLAPVKIMTRLIFTVGVITLIVIGVIVFFIANSGQILFMLLLVIYRKGLLKFLLLPARYRRLVKSWRKEHLNRQHPWRKQVPALRRLLP